MNSENVQSGESDVTGQGVEVGNGGLDASPHRKDNGEVVQKIMPIFHRRGE